MENKRRADDGSQVKELMRKMDQLVEERGGRYYETDLLLQELELESKRRARERRKKTEADGGADTPRIYQSRANE